jgi:hypothetical protein
LPPDIKISFARFDLNRQDWDGNITDLPDPPVFKTLGSCVVTVRDVVSWSHD